MGLTSGTRFGPYEIHSVLGAGGMGDVYRARDTKLERDVALKFIHDGFAGDRERQARFQREAQLLASLNHPHIGGIYGLEEAGGITALVLELVEGPTLAERIAEGPVPVNEALPIARQIAEALEAAHDQGIIHRDLKPANVKVRPDGTVKVLDFGLAKALESGSGMGDRGSEGLSMSPTLTSPAHTQVGVILGTAAYMAPEQARGRATDKRSDLWAYGCVLFEMFTGRRAFEGLDVTDTIAAIVRGEPDWSALPASTPPSIRRLLQRCLAKDPKLRLREAGSAILEIDEARTAPLPHAPAAAPRRRLMLPLAAAVAVALVLVSGYIAWPRSSSEPLTRLTMPVAPATTLRNLTNTGSIVAISDDGRQVAFVGVGPGGAQLFVRGLDQAVATGLSGTIGATGPAFSPDGRWLSYAVGQTLFRIEVGGGAPQAVTTLPDTFVGATWIDNDWLAFATRQGLMKVRVAGAEPERVTSVDTAAGQIAHAYPAVVPGGRFLAYTAAVSGVQGLQGDVWVVPIAGGMPRKLVGDAVSARATASGHLVFWRDGSLMAVPVDLSSMTLSGVPVTVQSGVEGIAPNWAAAASGTLAFVAAEDAGQASSSLTWLEDGRAVPAIDITRSFADPRISPDGRRVAVEVTAEGDDIWVIDLRRGTPSRLTFDGAEDETPAWSPDGEWIAYASDRSGQQRTIFRKRADGSGAEEKLWETAEHTHVDGWTPDGRALIVTRTDPKNANDVWLVPVGGGAEKARPLLHSSFNELNGRVSPDGRWLAYISNESGAEQVYVQPFPNLGAKWQVSARGGNQPVWAPDGRRLFYRGESALMAVDVEPTPRAFSAKAPVRVGEDTYSRKGVTHTGWDVGRDGRILLVRTGGGGGRPTQIQIVQHWLEDVTRRARSDR
jgi:Tol biopolymer transport system component